MDDLRRLPAWAQDAVRRVVHDLQQPVAIAMTLEFRPGAHGSGTLLVGEEEWPWGVGVPISAGAVGEDFVVDFADHLQEQFIPESSGAWGEARPRCPGHSHPASAALIEDEAWWTCPDDGGKLYRIGTFED